MAKGRPRIERDPYARIPMSTRVRGEVFNKLSEQARRNNRPLGNEVELLLEAGLKRKDLLDEVLELHFGRQLAGLLLILGRAMQVAGTSCGFQKTRTLEGSADWLREPWAYGQACRAAAAVLERYRPAGPIEPPDLSPPPIEHRSPEAARAFQEAFANPGLGYANGLLAAVDGRGATAELMEWGARRARQVGDLAEPPIGAPKQTEPGEP